MEKSLFKPFLVTGYPRSGTAWVANLLSTDVCTCIHEGTAFEGMEAWLDRTPNVGLSCPTATLHPWTKKLRTVLIVRDKNEALQAFLRAVPNLSTSGARAMFDRIEVQIALLQPELVIPFSELFNRGEELWNWAYPEVRSNSIRLAQLFQVKIEQDIQRSMSQGLRTQKFFLPDTCIG